MMRRVRLWVVGAGLLGCAATMRCQVSAADAKGVLELKLKGHSLMLRGFPGKTNIPYHWSKGQLVPETQGVFAMGVLKVKTIKTHMSSGVLDNVVVEGTRKIVVLEGGVPGLFGVLQEVALKIDMRDAPPTAIEDLEKKLAFDTTEEMLKAVPTEVADIAPSQPGGQHRPGEHSTKIEQNGTWSEISSEPGSYQAGRVLFAPDPEFSDAARRQRISFSFVMAMVVDSGGHVTETWLLRPAGFGLDEKLLEAGSSYRFSPFTYRGTAVGAVARFEIKSETY